MATSQTCFPVTTVHETWSDNSLTPTQLQKRKEEYEALIQQRNRYQSQLELFHLQSKDEILRIESNLRRLSMTGHQSEPTTPPEYQENGFSSGVRPNRLSLASLTSTTPGIGSIASPRTTRSGSQSINATYASSQTSTLPSYSVPQSRRGSDEEEDDLHFQMASTTIGRRPNG